MTDVWPTAPEGWEVSRPSYHKHPLRVEYIWRQMAPAAKVGQHLRILHGERTRHARGCDGGRSRGKTMGSIGVPEWATGLRLCKVVKDKLMMSEDVQFINGSAAVDTVLRRASISGRVGPVGETGDYWADFLHPNGDWAETIALDKGSWNSLKNHWMRCKMER